MKTYQTYQGECRQAEAKLRLVENQRLKIEQSLPKEKLDKSKKFRLIEKEVQKVSINDVVKIHLGSLVIFDVNFAFYIYGFISILLRQWVLNVFLDYFLLLWKLCALGNTPLIALKVNTAPSVYFNQL